MRITVVFTSDWDETQHLTVDKDLTLKQVSDMVAARFSGVAYIAFN